MESETIGDGPQTLPCPGGAPERDGMGWDHRLIMK
jgi:hypothetical protein